MPRSSAGTGRGISSALAGRICNHILKCKEVAGLANRGSSPVIVSDLIGVQSI